MIPENLRPLAQQLKDNFREQTTLRGLTTGDLPNWYGLVLTEMVLALDSQEVEYLTATYDHEARTARFIAVTASLIVDLHARNIEGQSAERDLRIVARRRISSLAVEAGETPFSQAIESRWPGDLTITVGYDGLDEVLRLPLERNRSSLYSERELFSALRDDLAQAGR